MEAFTVICETCHARLKVRNVAAIGQIHSCPKCESMVHIVPPAALAGGKFVHSPSAESSLAGNAAAAQSGSASAPSSLDDFAASGLDLESVASGARSVSQPPTELPDIDVGAEPIHPSPVLPTAADLFWRKVTIWGTAGGVGVFVLGGLVGALWVRSAADQSKADSTAVAKRVAVDPAGDVAPTVDIADESAASPNSHEELAESRMGSPDDQHPDADSVMLAAGNETADPTVDEVSPPPALPPLPAPSEDDQPPIASDPEPEPETNDEPRRKVDLLSFDPAYLDLALGISSGGAPLERPTTDDGEQEPVASFEPIDEEPTPAGTPHSAGVDQAMEETTDEVGPALANVLDEPAEPPQDVRAPVRRGPPSDPAVAPPAVAEQLALPLGEIEVSGAPLDQWLDSMADLLAIPITLEPQALVRAGVAVDQPITFRSSGATAGDVLKESLAAHRLTFKEQRGQLVVARAGMDERRTQTYRVEDILTTNQRDAQPIAELIQTLVEPQSWGSAGGQGRIEVAGKSLTIDHEVGVHLEVLVLLEKMLLARELPTKTKYPRERLSVRATYAELLPLVDGHTTFTLLPWTRLADVVRYWRRALGVSVLVDWQSLADVGLGPNSLMSCSAIDQRWEDALDAILAPLDLTWRAVDGRTIQITSRAAADNLRTIEFYPVADLVRRKFSGPDALIATVEKTLGQHAAATRFVYDTGSGYLLVLAPGDAHRQLTKRLATM